jgi:hypothetical protein
MGRRAGRGEERRIEEKRAREEKYFQVPAVTRVQTRPSNMLSPLNIMKIVSN